MTNFQIAEKLCEVKFAEFANYVNSTSTAQIDKIQFTPVQIKYDVYFISASTKFVAELKNINKEYFNYGIESEKYDYLKYIYNKHNIDPLYILFLPGGTTKVVNLNSMFENEKELKTKYWSCPTATVEDRGIITKKFYICEEKYTTNYAF